MIRPPRFGPGHPDHQLDCEEALEDAVIAALEPGRDANAFADLTAEAIAAGWEPIEIAVAVISIEDNRRLALEANAETDRQIAAALAEVTRH